MDLTVRIADPYLHLPETFFEVVPPEQGSDLNGRLPRCTRFSQTWVGLRSLR